MEPRIRSERVPPQASLQCGTTGSTGQRLILSYRGFIILLGRKHCNQIIRCYAQYGQEHLQ